MLKFYQKVNSVISYLFSNSINEKSFLKNFFGKKKVYFVDVGTNYSFFYDLISKYLKLNKTFFFEPSKECFQFLKKKYKKKYSNFKFSCLK